MIRTVVNTASLLGWSWIAFHTIQAILADNPAGEDLLQVVLIAQVVCASETLQIAFGILRGDLALSFVVQYTRLMMYFITFPHTSVSSDVVKTILLAWSLTEMARFPMVLFPKSKNLRTIRYAVPLITFPMGAGTEAYAAYLVFLTTENMLLKAALGLIVLVNVVGGTVWYPGMVKKVTRSLKGEKKKAK
ncbi:hypothetical protein TrLO_g13544 [Triparma laevis f. longispina]|nr:hypothetical protein TrLO_g13544 [Triparma laevis f. longispina]